MNNIKLFYSSIGRKFLMALTGLFLCIFLIEHLYGNLLILKGDNGVAFNEYSHSLTSNLFIRIVEIVLFLAFIVHIVDAIVLTRKNKQSRPVPYVKNAPEKNSSWFSRNMGLTGSLILVFLVIHLKDFFYKYRIEGLEKGETLYNEVVESFHQFWYVAIYVIAFLFLAFHLNHGFQSAFQSLGLSNKKYSPIIKKTGTLFAILIAIGYSVIPLIIFFTL